MIDDAKVDDVTIVANLTTFAYLNFVYSAIEVYPNYLVCKALQSRNEIYSRGQVCSLNDSNAIKVLVLQLTQTQC